MLTLHILAEDGLTPWQQYLEEKKRRRKESRRRKTHPMEPDEQVADSKEPSGHVADSGFDDPFFQHGVTMATAVSGWGVQWGRTYGDMSRLLLGNYQA